MSEADYPTKELDLIADVITEAQEKQATNDKTSDKYRWHDLRKDRNDLPHKDDFVLIAYHEYFGIQYVTCGVGSWFWQNHDLIAWREIEPFEESV